MQISTHAVTADKSVSLLGGLTAIVKRHALFGGCSTHKAVHEPVTIIVIYQSPKSALNLIKYKQR